MAPGPRGVRIPVDEQSQRPFPLTPLERPELQAAGLNCDLPGAEPGRSQQFAVTRFRALLTPALADLTFLAADFFAFWVLAFLACFVAFLSFVCAFFKPALAPTQAAPGPVSTLKPREAGVGSTVPSPLVTRTEKVCGPPLSPETVFGEVQGAKLPPSMLQLNEDSGSVELKPKVADVVVTVDPAAGPESIVVSGVAENSVPLSLNIWSGDEFGGPPFSEQLRRGVKVVQAEPNPLPGFLITAVLPKAVGLSDQNH